MTEADMLTLAGQGGAGMVALLILWFKVMPALRKVELALVKLQTQLETLLSK